MKTEKNTVLDAHQQQLAVRREISEVFFEGAGRIESVWLEQTGRILDEQLKFFRATAAVNDPQGLAALHTTFFSRSPSDLLDTQQQILSVVTETQSRIREFLSKHISSINADEKPLWGAANTTNIVNDLTQTCYTAWHKAFQGAMDLASLGVKAIPLSLPEPGSIPTSKKESAPAKG
ncbi:phasin family protein [Alcaligenaceae bacterium]|nr:phasin family protein [Alcaligenaceae bacterium]